MAAGTLAAPPTFLSPPVKVCCIWVAFLALGIMAVALPVLDYFRAVPGDLADGRFNSIVLEHLYLWTKGVEPSLWSPGFFYAYPGALTFSDNHFGSGAIYVLLRYMGLDREYAFDGWYLASYFLNFAACFHALRRFGHGALASACGAFVFAFALPVTEHCIHTQLGFRFAVPLAMASFHDLIERRELRQLGYLSAWVAFEFYCSIYIGFFLAFLLVAYTVATSLPWKVQGKRVDNFWTAALDACSRASRRQWLTTAAWLLFSVVALVVLLYPYAHYSKIYGFVRLAPEISGMLPRWGSYLLADGSNIWRGLSAKVEDVPVRYEQQMFLGVGVIALVLAGIGYRRDRWAAASLVALGLLVLVTMKFPHFSIYYKLLKLPGINAIRAVVRIILVMLFPVSVLVARGVERSVQSPRNRILAAVVAVSVVMMLVECMAVASFKTPITKWRDRLALYDGKLPATLAPDAILFVPLVSLDDPQLPEIDGVILAQDRGLVTLNGFSGNTPPAYPTDFDNPCHTASVRVLSYAKFAKLQEPDTAALLKRVVPVGMPDCHPGQIK
ncbi:hypothetical protein [Pinirhizobacter soli]|uniref:hypothetical protein n=1 Tax=Pinirhizobacter soli TaxID=2786953 RepID=UPI002029E6AC|nr:hypothetical protein [Pinirhizobacter soli]